LEKGVTIQITEPTTMITDYLLGAWTLYLGIRLFTKGKALQQNCVNLWSVFLIAVGIAAFTGGTYHGFDFYLADLTRDIIWKFTLGLILIACLFSLYSVIIAFFQDPYKKWFCVAATLKFAVFLIWIMAKTEFKYVIYDYASSMVFILILQVIAKMRYKEKSAFWIIAGILIAFIGAGIQQSKVIIHEHFNHNDLYHVIQMIAVYLWYKGGGLLRDK
jgi:small-conductance mechanosensitive channel